MTQGELILVLGANGLISFAMLAIGLISYVRTKRFLASAVETRGTVVEFVYKGTDDGSAMYSPKIDFKTITGQPVQFIENWSTNRPDCKPGDEVIVLYNPENPQKARRGGKKWKFFFVAWLVGGLGLLFSSILLIVFIIFLIVGFPVKG